MQYKDLQLTVFESALFRTTSSVICTKDLCLVVDPTWLPHEVAGIRHYVADKMEGRQCLLLFTHSDYDHILGYRAFPEFRVIASEAFVQNEDKEAIIQQILRFDGEYYIRRTYPIEYPKVDYVVKQAGQSLKLGNTELVFFLAPGHNKDGIWTLVLPLGIWLVGDYLSNIEFPYIYDSSEKYLATLHQTPRLLAQFPMKVLVSGHGDVATSTTEVTKRYEDSLRYIEELQACIHQGIEYEVEKLWQQYHFPLGMQSFHEGNIRLMKKEAGLD